MTTFEAPDYRRFLLAASEGRGLRAALARAAGCQPSYFSQALGGHVHLTEDHLLGIAAHLSLGAEETEHLLLLLRLEKASTEKLRAYLKAQLQRSRKEATNLKNKVKGKEPRANEKDLGTYVASWIPGAVHLLTSDPAHQTTEAIAKRLSLPPTKVSETLHFLEKAGFVQRTPKGWSYLAGSLHLPKGTPWHASLEAARRELAARSIALGQPDTVHFSSLFTVDAAELRKLERQIAKLIETSHELIAASGTSKLACLSVDLFEVV